METIEQVCDHLGNSGYSQFVISDRAYRLSIGSLLLLKTLTGWRVYETERNDVAQTFLETSVGSEAIRLFLQMVSSRTYHLRTCNNTMELTHLESLLQTSNVPFRRWVASHQSSLNVPYEGWLSVFVAGKDLLRAQHVAATLDRE